MGRVFTKEEGGKEVIPPREKKKIMNEFEKLQKKYEKKLVLTGRDVTLFGSKTRFLHVFDFWELIKEMNNIIERVGKK